MRPTFFLGAQAALLIVIVRAAVGATGELLPRDGHIEFFAAPDTDSRFVRFTGVLILLPFGVSPLLLNVRETFVGERFHFSLRASAACSNRMRRASATALTVLGIAKGIKNAPCGTGTAGTHSSSNDDAPTGASSV